VHYEVKLSQEPDGFARPNSPHLADVLACVKDLSNEQVIKVQLTENAAKPRF
jgi:hypothetical protein